MAPRSDLATQYDPAGVEDRIYALWEKERLFGTDPDPDRSPYTIVIPPPNVTGVLHMGHALNETLQDIVIRFQRMRGRESLWLPGTDHAGVATQAVVEREIWEKEGRSRHDLGRDELLRRIWSWKEEHGGTIFLQLRKLGCSCDWSRTRFTMDEGLSRAVRLVFVRLFKEGLVYRGRRLVNWSCPLQTALSDDELEYKEIDGHFWYIRYPVKGEPGRFVSIATTRPETMLGDTAVAVHPDDARYRDLPGKVCILPLLGREIPIIADAYVKMDEGTGCLKVTPAHDPNDFDIGGRHTLPAVNILNPDGTLNENAGPYRGMDRLAARPKVVADLRAQGLLERTEPHRHAIAHCYRSGDPIEPYLSEQWFVRMPPLVEKARAAELGGRVRFHPERWSRTFHQWLDSTPDWCISRQIWWGHRIPVWTCSGCGKLISEIDDPKACPDCGAAELTQDPDVLDTWFSSQLWPFSTLGWPERTRDLDYYYPTNLLVTDRGIIALWVARMIMMGEHFMEKEPFSDVYIHGTILDRDGRRMSKSLRNGIDPLVMIRGGTNIDGTVFEKGYGADAVRFTLTAMTTEGQDLRIWPERFEAGRNFANKLWNVSRFCLMHLEGPDAIAADLRPGDLVFEDRWIVSRLHSTIQKVTECGETFRYCDFAGTVREFVWGEFCDWYVELVKARLKDGGDPEAARVARRVLAYTLDRTLRLLHPITPFITEEIWGILGERLPARPLFGPREGTPEGRLIRAAWPDADLSLIDPGAEAEMAFVQETIRAMRDLRSRYHGAPYNLSPRARVGMAISASGERALEALERHRDILEFDRQANADITLGREIVRPPHSAVSVTQEFAIYLPLEGIVDIAAERARLDKEREKVMRYIERCEGKLANEDFIKRAPPAIIEGERARLDDARSKLADIDAHIADLE